MAIIWSSLGLVLEVSCEIKSDPSDAKRNLGSGPPLPVSPIRVSSLTSSPIQSVAQVQQSRLPATAPQRTLSCRGWGELGRSCC
eukprot:7977081-Alexandrium_andersonii.AAC.1